MKVKFNLFERVAGLFVLGAVVGSVVMSVGVAVKKGWFDPKISLKTKVHDAEGIRVGTPVKMSGLVVGEISQIDFSDSNEIIVIFNVAKKFQNKIKKDSVVSISRPFVIGEKALEINLQDSELDVAEAGDFLVSRESVDLLSFLSSDTLSQQLTSVSKIMESLNKLAQDFFATERTSQMVALFDKMIPLLDDLHKMSINVALLTDDLNDKKVLKNSIKELNSLSKQMNQVLPVMAENAPELTKNMSKMVANLAVLTDDFSELIPIIQKIAPKMPEASDKAIQALNETVTTLKAMQKTFLLRGAVRDVLEEDKKNADRLPAKSED